MTVALSALSTILLVLVSTALAQLPYNPPRLILSSDKSKIYQFSIRQSQPALSYFDITQKLTSSTNPIVVSHTLPFDTADRAFTTIADDKGISILVGDCQDTPAKAELWRFKINKDGKTGTWGKLELQSRDTSLSSNYLAAGFSFSANGSVEDTSLYAFGGMCPNGQSNATSWTSEASYSNTMLSIAASKSASPYQLSVTGARAPPIPEAGLTITPLSLVSTKSAAGQMSQQQNFVLLGGHTQNAFINMSQVALFSLPEASWAFLGVNQPNGGSGELLRRDAVVVEPRSGHTAALTEDGSKIIVFGGWVGTVTNPATPSLAVLQVGQGYGGSSSWQWAVPKQTGQSLSMGQGLYGHAAVMLPGDVMMVVGGQSIGASKRKRSTQNYMFFNANTGEWSSNYHNNGPSNSSGLDSKQKAGLGAGLGLGLTAIIAVVVVWLLYRRRLREKRAERERYLRELAFGSERFQSSSRVPSRLGGRYSRPEMRSASWSSRQEQQIEHDGLDFALGNRRSEEDWQRHSDDEPRGVERTGTEVPSPTRGLRKNLTSRGPASYGNNFHAPVTGPGSVFRIDEVEEESSVRSLRVKTPCESRMSDPFKDPPNLEPPTPAEERKREVQGWVEDWENAANNMNVSRNTSQARTYSNLSQAQQSHSESSSYKTGRESPEKSDRTGSNLSERSEFSIQKSVGTLSRQISQRSVSAGYALFAGAAAAMGKWGAANKEPGLERGASRRSVTHSGATRGMASATQRPMSQESRTLLLRDHSPTKSIGDISPIKDYKNYSRTSSLTSQRKRTGILGSVKRVFTGTSQVDVQAQVEHYEEKVEEVNAEPEMSETPTSAPAFWRSKRGAKDWDEDDPNATMNTSEGPPSASMNRRRRSTIDGTSSVEDYDGEDWDVETAVQKRVVQVMFTVPKEKLRVVNADALSLISRSDVDERDDRDRKAELRRMTSVREDDDGGGGYMANEEAEGKGKQRA